MSDRSSDVIFKLKQVSLKADLGSAYLLHDISVQISRGDKVAIIGASGSGKTSLLRLFNRLSTPSTGEIYFATNFLTAVPPIQLRRQVALIPQEPKLLGMSVAEALNYPLQLQKLSSSEIKQRVATWLELLRIPSEWLNRNELQLSLGQRQLVAIARALVMQPQVLLLDEPTSALDVGTAQNLITILNQLNRDRDLTMVMVNHQLELMGNFADRILYLADGQLTEDLLATDAAWSRLSQKLRQARADAAREWL